jgi:Flp pilus assembly pilin Flp
MISRHHPARQRRHPRGDTKRPAIGLRAFVVDERGQDVIEYGLLSALFGIVCIAVWLSIEGRLRANYLGYDADVQNLWASPAPGGS